MYSRKSIIKKTRKKKTQEAGKKFLWKIGGGALLCVAVLGMLAWQSGNEKMLISSIAISGNEVVHEKDLRDIAQKEMAGKYLWLFHKDNIAIYPASAIKKNIFNLDTRIREVHIYRDSFTSITIEISERKPSFVWCAFEDFEKYSNARMDAEQTRGDADSINKKDKKCFFMDKSGYIFAEAPRFSGSVFFEFYGERDFEETPLGKKLFATDTFLKLVSFKTEVKKFGFNPIALIERADDDYDLLLQDGTKIVFNEQQDVGVLLGNLSAAIEKIAMQNEELDYIDLRFENKVFYRFVE